MLLDLSIFNKLTNSQSQIYSEWFITSHNNKQHNQFNENKLTVQLMKTKPGDSENDHAVFESAAS